MAILASIIIPTYNHAAFVAEAIDCALAQTVPCEVIVVDDGSTDETPSVLARYADRIRIVTRPHSGPSLARNAGIEAARGECVMFLDADDLMVPQKVERQLETLVHHPEAGWVLCDVDIRNAATGRTTTASVQYAYDKKELGGWIQPLLIAANFIPVMSPLIRRAVLGDAIRFDDAKVPEDWHFWVAVAGAARVRYLPEVLATYRHRREGRSRLPKTARQVHPNVVAPLRLNLGCGTPDTRSWHPMPGMVNLDKALGWTFEQGLKDFSDRSVAGITISHALMYVAESAWPGVFAEFARVLMPGGVIRITEDETQDPRSARLGGWQGSEPAVTLTSPMRVRTHLERVGLVATDVTCNTTAYRDRTLCQAQHGAAPDVFFIEGVRPSRVLFAPHNDDETLFASFTILRYRPAIVVCFPSVRDYGDPAVREAETRESMTVLGGGPVTQWHGGDLVAQMRAFDAQNQPIQVWAPDVHASHPDHVAVARAAAEVFADRVRTYHTYDERGKVRSDRPVAFEPAWVGQKLRALTRYPSQMSHPRAYKFFVDDLLEYEGEISA